MSTLLKAAFEQADQSIQNISTNTTPASNDLPAGIETYKLIGSIIGGFGIVIVAFLASMLLYIYFRKRFSHCRWGIEIAFIGLAVLLCTVLNINLYCYANIHNITYAKAIAYSFHGLFNGMGHLTFNGADAAAEGLSHGFICVYYGSALYAALMFFGVLTAKANYEFFSSCILHLPECKKPIYVFTALNNETLLLAKSIVNQINEENANIRQTKRETKKELAKLSIKERLIKRIQIWKVSEEKRKTARETKKSLPSYQQKKAFVREDRRNRRFARNCNKKQRCIIVFAIPSPKPFDRHDELCREAMANGFFYISYSAESRKKRLLLMRLIAKQKDKPVSIAQRLHLNNWNCFWHQNSDFCVFAFDSDNYSPNEEQNMASVFGDIENRIDANSYDHLRINYYILTNRQINYSAYDYKLRELKYKYFLRLIEKHKKRPHVVEKYILNTNREANLDVLFGVEDNKDYLDNSVKRYFFASKQERVAMADSDDRLKTIEKAVTHAFAHRFIVNVWNEPDVIAKTIMDGATPALVDRFESNNTDVIVMSLGFGGTGAAAAMALYSLSSYLGNIGEDNTANDYFVYAYDIDAQRIGACISREKPYCLVSMVAADGTETLLQNRTKESLDGEISDRNLRLYEAYKDYEPTKKEHCVFYPVSADALQNEMRYPHLIFHNENCRDLTFLDCFDESPKNTPRPQFVVIATGDDFENVRMANAIIQTVINNSLLCHQEQVDVFVNVWDKENNDLLLSGGGDWDEDTLTLTIKTRERYDENGKILPMTMPKASAETEPQKQERVILCVHIIGNNDTLYSAANTIDINAAAAFNHQYNTVSDKGLNEKFIDWYDKKYQTTGKPNSGATICTETFFVLFMQTISNANIKRYALPPEPLVAEEKEYKNMKNWIDFYTDYIQKQFDTALTFKMKLDYYKLDLWLKESNAMVVKSAAIYYQLLKRFLRLQSPEEDLTEKELVEVYAKLSALEHQRWNRFHMANGWIYNGKLEKQELISQHNCIIPYAYVDLSTVIYDLSNILMAWKYGIPKTNDTPKDSDNGTQQVEGQTTAQDAHK